jgi:enoyl-CoA hydratase/carnithine racemase
MNASAPQAPVPQAAAPHAAAPHAAVPYVTRHDEGGTATLTLQRGERYNPLSLPMIEALHGHLRAIAAQPSVRSVVLAATGPGFSAGHDLRELRAHADDPAWLRSLFDACAAMMVAIGELPQPVIARVHGLASAAGCQLVAACDLAVAAEAAKFVLPGVNIGVFCSSPAVAVARNLPRKQTMEMLLTGDAIDAQAALARGLVNRVVPAQGLDEAVTYYTRRISERPASIIAAGKKTFYAQIDRPLAAAYALASAAMVEHVRDPAAAEGIDALLGKRAPHWPS